MALSDIWVKVPITYILEVEELRKELTQLQAVSAEHKQTLLSLNDRITGLHGTLYAYMSRDSR